MTVAGSAAGGVAAATLLVGLLACGAEPVGHLSAPGHVAVAGPSQTGRTVAVGGPWLCSTGSAPVRLVSVEPVTRVGQLDLRPAVHLIDTADPTDLVGGGADPLPGSYGPVAGVEVPACSSAARLVLGLEARRRTGRSAAVAGLRIRYEENRERFHVDADMSVGLCGGGGASDWQGELGRMQC